MSPVLCNVIWSDMCSGHGKHTIIGITLARETLKVWMGLVHSMLYLLIKHLVKKTLSPIKLLPKEKIIIDTELIYSRGIGLQVVEKSILTMSYHEYFNQLKYKHQCSKTQENEDLLKYKVQLKQNLKKESYA